MTETSREEIIRRVLLVGDTTLDPLARALDRSAEEPRLQTSVAPYGQIYQTLLDFNHPAWSAQPETLIVWTTPERTLPSFDKLLRFESASLAAEYEAGLREAENFADAVLHAAERVGQVLVSAWTLPPHERWIQSLRWKHGLGVANFLARANLMLAEKFSARNNIQLLDVAFWRETLGRPAYDARMYAFAKILYTPQFFEKAACEIKSVLRGALGRSRKVVVCDLDNTLWGGVVGDDGMQNLKLGAPDPVGECFSDFQRALKSLASRGILLAICSKNDEQVALAAMDEHPSMILRRGDFAAWRINWNDKAVNLAELAAELNLGLDSFVFLDDSSQERDQVRQLLPAVFTPDLPASPSMYASFLTGLDCFETASLGKEDFERTEMYRTERSRKQAYDHVQKDVAGWLGTLGVQVRAALLSSETLPRATQLLNKTNQFNLALRRMDEQSLWTWAQQSGHALLTFNVVDRFGDFGLVGLAGISVEGAEARMTDFVMSCRVMGKQVEDALLASAWSYAQNAGARTLTATAVDGPRNGPVKNFFASKLAAEDSGLIDLTRILCPLHIQLKEEYCEPETAPSLSKL